MSPLWQGICAFILLLIACLYLLRKIFFSQNSTGCSCARTCLPAQEQPKQLQKANKKTTLTSDSDTPP